MKQQVGSILKRQLQEGEGEAGGEVEEDEEESAYNEHFRNNGDKPPPGEFRVPSVRVRPSGPGPAPPAHQDYTGTATEQGKHDGEAQIFLLFLVLNRLPLKYFHIWHWCQKT